MDAVELGARHFVASVYEGGTPEDERRPPAGRGSSADCGRGRRFRSSVVVCLVIGGHILRRVLGSLGEPGKVGFE